jgi:4-diphosphocytidyl-2-C-methyl-D-erythritol kinase
MSLDTLTIQCPAKINLALSVGPPSPEDGLHPICSWMVAVDFYDTLTLTRAADGRNSFEISWSDDAPRPQSVDWPLTSDLAFSGHAHLQAHVGRELPVNVEMKKRIPAGAGLGGGSSDAAGMLLGLNRLFALGLDDTQLGMLALHLGSDVVFMVLAGMFGNSAIVSGIGDQIELVESGSVIDIVLIFPPVSCSTADVYRAYDATASHPTVDGQRVRVMSQADSLLNDAPFNDLTEAAFTVQPTLRAIRDQIHEATGMPVHLSGSGSAMFIVVPNREQGAAISQRITKQTGLESICVQSPPGKAASACL